MAFKRLFGDSTRAGVTAEHTIEDLIVLERYDEAAERLKARLKGNMGDLHARLKLAEVYTSSKQFDKAVDEYTYVAGEYAADGFFDKALALLARATRLRPLDDTLRRKLESYERGKRLEHSRVAALEGLRSGTQSDTQRQRSAVELQQIWQNLASSSLVLRLPSDQVKRLFSVMEMVRVERGAVLAERGSGLAQMALIGRGTVEALVPKRGGGETVLRTFSNGDLIGEGALLEHRPWPATYRAVEPTMLLTLARDGLEQALMGNPDPRGFLEALREQHNDRAVAAAVHQLGIEG